MWCKVYEKWPVVIAPVLWLLGLGLGHVTFHAIFFYLLKRDEKQMKKCKFSSRRVKNTGTGWLQHATVLRLDVKSVLRCTRFRCRGDKAVDSHRTDLYLSERPVLQEEATYGHHLGLVHSHTRVWLMMYLRNETVFKELDKTCLRWVTWLSREDE